MPIDDTFALIGINHECYDNVVEISIPTYRSSRLRVGGCRESASIFSQWIWMAEEFELQSLQVTVVRSW